MTALPKSDYFEDLTKRMVPSYSGAAANAVEAPPDFPGRIASERAFEMFTFRRSYDHGGIMRSVDEHSSEWAKTDWGYTPKPLYVPLSRSQFDEAPTYVTRFGEQLINRFAASDLDRWSAAVGKPLDLSIDVPEPTGTGEDFVDHMAGLVSFVARLMTIKAIPIGNVPAPLHEMLAWEAENQISGGAPGKGALMAAVTLGIGKLPGTSVMARTGKLSLESGIFGGASALEGGTPMDILFSAAVPPAIRAGNTMVAVGKHFQAKLAEAKTAREAATAIAQLTEFGNLAAQMPEGKKFTPEEMASMLVQAGVPEAEAKAAAGMELQTGKESPPASAETPSIAPGDSQAPKLQDSASSPNEAKSPPSGETPVSAAAGESTASSESITQQVPAKQSWQMTYSELSGVVKPGTKAELETARPILKELFPQDDPRITAEPGNDPWGIHRAIHVGDEIPRVPVVDLSLRHRDAIKRALAEGRTVPPEVLADYPDLTPTPARPAPENPAQAAVPSDKAAGPEGSSTAIGASMRDAAAKRIADRAKQGGVILPSGLGRLNPFFENLPDHIVILAIDAINAGIRGAKAIKAFVADRVKGDPKLEPYADVIARETHRVMRDAADETGKKVDESKIDYAAQAMTERIRKAVDDMTTKQRIREATRRPEQKPTITEGEALKGSMKAQERVAKEAFSAGKAQGVEEASAPKPQTVKQRIMESIRGPKKEVTEADALRASLRAQARAAAQAYRTGVRFIAEQIPQIKADLIAKMKDKAADIRAIKTQIRQLVQTHIDASRQGKFLTSIEKAQTDAAVDRALDKMWDVAAQTRYDGSLNALKRAVKRLRKTKFTPERKAEIVAALAAVQANVYSDQPRTVTRKDGTTYEARTRRSFGNPNERLVAADAIDAARETLLGIQAEQRMEHKLRIAGRVMLRETLVADLLAGMNPDPTATKIDGLSVSREASFLGRAHQMHLNQDTIATLMRSKAAMKVLVEAMWDGETSYHRDQQRAQDAKKAASDRAGYHWGSDALRRLSGDIVGHQQATKQEMNLPDAGPIVATPAEWMQLYGTLTDARAGTNIRGGAPVVWLRDVTNKPIEITAKDADAIIAGLDPALKGIVDDLKRYMETQIRPELFKTIRRMTGVEPEIEQGWIHTMRRRETTPEKALNKPMAEHVRRTLEGIGLLKPRVAYDAKTPYIIGDFFSQFDQVVRQSAAITHMTEPVRNAELLFKDKRTELAVQQRFGKAMNKRISDIIEAGKLVFHDPMSSSETIAAFLNRNIGRSKVSLSASVMLKQIGGMFKAAAEVGPKYALEAIPHIYAPEVTDILTNGAAFRNRYDNPIWNRVTPGFSPRGHGLGEGAARDAVGRLLTRDAAHAVGELVDKIKIYNAADAMPIRMIIASKIMEFEATMKDRGFTPARRRAWIEREAEFAMRRSQNTGSSLDMSEIALDARGNPWMAPFAMFSSDNNKSYNMVARALASKDPSKIALTLTAVTLNNAWAAGVTAALAAWTSTAYDPKRRRTAGENFSQAFVRNVAGMSYLGTTAADIGINVYEQLHKRTREIDVANPVLDTLTTAYKGTRDLLLSVFDNGDFKTGPNKGDSRSRERLLRGIEETGTSAAELFGLPVVPIYNQAKPLFTKPEKAKTAPRY